MKNDSNTITATLEDGRAIQCAHDTSVGELLDNQTAANGLDILGVLVNNDAVSFSYKLEVDSHVKFLTLADSHGWRIYR
ncbi:MAG: hypothetical protein AAF570_28475, partial [Bacteroidota bacterium]